MNLLDALYLPLALGTMPWWARKTRSDWGARFGRLDLLPDPKPGQARVLLHAVSVGEVAALRGVIPLLLARGLSVVVSVGTDTGITRARELYANLPGVIVVRYPLDFSPAVGRFLDAVRPDAVALVELEVWPNFVRECASRHIPIGIINGRLSARSFRRYALGRAFLRPTFARLAFAAVQDEDYAQRFTHMGVHPDRVHISGNMKWDAMPVLAPGTLPEGAARLADELGIDRTKPLIVAGSTAPTDDSCEEAILNAACNTLPPDVQLLCAPRKPEHYETAFAAMGGPGVCVRRSLNTSTKAGVNPALPSNAHRPKRFLLDTIGELRLAYALADLVFVGRTLGDQGGSDPIEPVAMGKPVVIGPNFANFTSVVRVLQEAGGIVITDQADLSGVLAGLLANPEQRSRLVHAGQQAIVAQQGASARHAELICSLLGSRAQSGSLTSSHRHS